MMTYINLKKIFFRFTVASFVFGFSFATSQNIYSQNGGFKYIRNFSNKEYDHKPQNWSIVQDRRGIIYIGNHGGLLEYDGVSWRLIRIPNWSARSLAIDNAGTIYIGGRDEIGFLAPGSKGSMQYVSLLGHLEDNQKKFSTVWETFSTGDGVYFQASKFLFRWNPNHRQMKVWAPPGGINAAFCCEGKLFIRREKVGLMQIDSLNDSFELIPGGETFANKLIYMMALYESGKLLIGTRKNGFYLYDGIKAKPFPTQADDYLEKKQLYHGIRLLSSPGDFALATRLGGLVIINPYGRLKQIFNKASGLQDDSVKYVFEDSLGNLWLGLSSGVSKIEYTSPISLYDRRSDLPGLILSVIRHEAAPGPLPRNLLYAGTTSGLYFLVSTGEPGNSGKFHPVPGMSSVCWALLSTGDSLLAATDSGVIQVGDKNKNEKNIKLITERSYVLLRSNKNKNRIWVGTGVGLYSCYLYAENGQWVKERKVEI